MKLGAGCPTASYHDNFTAITTLSVPVSSMHSFLDLFISIVLAINHKVFIRFYELNKKKYSNNYCYINYKI